MGRTPTPKQLEFANAIVSGAAPSEAYRQAYRADGMSSASVAREAQRLLSNPVIAPIVEEGRREAAEAAKWSLRKSLERLQAVNDRCYEELLEGMDGTALRGFTDTLDRLNELADVKREAETDTVPRIVFTPSKRQ